jgi:hypothetical protein
VCAASFGASSALAFWMASFVFDWSMLRKTLTARVSSSPERSMASIVLANVGGSGRSAIAAISASCCFMPSSTAGW